MKKISQTGGQRMNKLREKIVEDFINALSEDVIPWEKDWYMTVTPTATATHTMV